MTNRRPIQFVTRVVYPTPTPKHTAQELLDVMVRQATIHKLAVDQGLINKNVTDIQHIATELEFWSIP